MYSKKNVATIALLIYILALASSLNAQIRYNAIDLGGLDGCAYSVNNNGKIVGVSRNSWGYERATLFDPNGNNIDLGTLDPSDFSQSCAFSINNDGSIVGASEGYATFFGSIYGWGNYKLGGSIPVLGTARSIDDNGLIVGAKQDTPQSNRRAFIYFDDLAFTLNLGTLGGDFSEAYCVTANPQSIRVVGAAQNASGHQRAVLFNSVMRDGVNIDLGTLGGISSTAYSVNVADQIVGVAETGAGSHHATVFDSTGSGSNLDLGTLPVLDTFLPGNSEAYAVNSNGQIVGWSEDENYNWCATLFDPTGLGNNIDLNTVVSPDSGLHLIHAYGINDHGWIVGDAWTEDGTVHAFLLTPIPQPCQYAITGDLNNDCKVNFFDFAALAGQWCNNCDSQTWCNNADFDHSQKVDFSDLIMMTTNWLIDCDSAPDQPACVLNGML